jgi:hypothetical protein
VESAAELPPGVKPLVLDGWPKVFNNAMPTLAADAVDICVRIGTMNMVGGALVRFYSITPEAAIELARVHCNADLLRSLIDLMAGAVGYYPVKPATAPNNPIATTEERIT